DISDRRVCELASVGRPGDLARTGEPEPICMLGGETPNGARRRIDDERTILSDECEDVTALSPSGRRLSVRREIERVTRTVRCVHHGDAVRRRGAHEPAVT